MREAQEERVIIVMSTALKKRLDAEAKKTERSRSSLVRFLLGNALGVIR